MHTKDFLAQELRKAGLQDMAAKAAEGYYHDYLSPLDSPAIALMDDLAKAGTPPARALRRRHLDGEFDASDQEGEDWMRSKEGQDTLNSLIRK